MAIIDKTRKFSIFIIVQVFDPVHAENPANRKVYRAIKPDIVLP